MPPGPEGNPRGTPTPTPTRSILSLGALGAGKLGTLASADDDTLRWFAATYFNSTSTVDAGSYTLMYVLVSETPTPTVPVPATSPAGAADSISITSFGTGVAKAVVQAYPADESGFTTLGIQDPISDMTKVFLFQIERMGDTGTLMNDLPFTFAVPANGYAGLSVTSFSTDSTGQTTSEDVATAGGSITLSADGATFTIAALHTSAFAGTYLAPSDQWAWWLLFLLLLVPIGLIVLWCWLRSPSPEPAVFDFEPELGPSFVEPTTLNSPYPSVNPYFI